MFLHPKRCTRVQCLILKNNPNYVNFWTSLIPPLTFEWPPGDFHSQFHVFYRIKSPGGGHSTLGYAPCATKKTLLFFARFHRKTPIFTNFHPMTPCFSKILTFLTKCWEIFSHFGPESPYFLSISLKDPLFLCALSLKDPLFWRNLSPKDPYIWGAWWHSYVTFICEYPLPPG